MERLPGFEHPRIGVGVMVVRAGKVCPVEVLLGKRKGSHAAGEYAFPGGHLENGESVEECAWREVMEETGLEIGAVGYRFTALIGEYAPAKHYVHIGVMAWIGREGAEAKLMEPDKCEGWGWYDVADRFPAPIMGPTALALHEHRNVCGFYDLTDAAIAIEAFRAKCLRAR